MKVLYVPLDDRPCNYKYPQLLSEISSEIEMIVPPFEYIGYLKIPADIEKIWQWIFDNIKDCTYAILSVDTLVYGNILNSRIHNKTLEECYRNMKYFLKIKEIQPQVEIHAFNLVTRVANYNGDAEDPTYWKEYGEMIWKYGFLMDKVSRGEGDSTEKEQLDALGKTIPEEVLNNFLRRRQINSNINLKCLELAKAKTIDYLVIPKDDCAEYGFAAIEQDLIARKIYEYRIMDRVMIYPGADEVGSTLLARVFNRFKSFQPKIFIRYSSTMGPYIIPKYEDRYLNESIKSQVTSVGGIIVNEEKEADFLLAVNSPGKEVGEAFDQYVQNNGNRNCVNWNEFIFFIKYFWEKYKKPYAIADVAFANGADDQFMIYASQSGVLQNACAYGGWNTAQNTIGVALAQASLCSYYNNYCDESFIRDASTAFLLRKIIEDWFMQARSLQVLARKHNEITEFNMYKVGNYRNEALSLIKACIDENIKSEFGGEFRGKQIIIDKISLPWDRVFEIDFETELLDRKTYFVEGVMKNAAYDSA